MLAGESRAVEGTLVFFPLNSSHLVRIKRVKCHGLIKGRERLLAPCFLCHTDKEKEMKMPSISPLCSCWLCWFAERKIEKEADRADVSFL